MKKKEIAPRITIENVEVRDCEEEQAGREQELTLEDVKRLKNFLLAERWRKIYYALFVSLCVFYTILFVAYVKGPGLKDDFSTFFDWSFKILPIWFLAAMLASFRISKYDNRPYFYSNFPDPASEALLRQYAVFKTVNDDPEAMKLSIQVRDNRKMKRLLRLLSLVMFFGGVACGGWLLAVLCFFCVYPFFGSIVFSGYAKDAERKLDRIRLKRMKESGVEAAPIDTTDYDKLYNEYVFHRMAWNVIERSERARYREEHIGTDDDLPPLRGGGGYDPLDDYANESRF